MRFREGGESDDDSENPSLGDAQRRFLEENYVFWVRTPSFHKAPELAQR